MNYLSDQPSGRPHWSPFFYRMFSKVTQNEFDPGSKHRLAQMGDSLRHRATKTEYFDDLFCLFGNLHAIADKAEKDLKTQETRRKNGKSWEVTALKKHRTALADALAKMDALMERMA